MHRRLGSATLSQLAFPREKQPEFPIGEIPLGQYSCKKAKKKKKEEEKTRTKNQTIIFAYDILVYTSPPGQYAEDGSRHTRETLQLVQVECLLPLLLYRFHWPLPRLRYAGLLTACNRSTCLHIWLTSLSFIQLPFRSICTSSASLLVEWRMKKSRGTENSGNKIGLQNVVLLMWTNRNQASVTYFGNKAVKLHNTNVWNRIAIIQHTESTWVLELLVTG